MQQGQILCSPATQFYVTPVPIQFPISHDYTLDTQRLIICLFICLITSHQQTCFKSRAQSCLTYPISLVKSHRFQKPWGRLHAFGRNTLVEIICVHQWKKNATWLIALLIRSPQLFIHFLPKITVSIPWLFKCHCYSSHKWDFGILNERFACMPKMGGEMSRRFSWEWQRTWEDIVCEIIWVTFMKGLEAVVVSLRKKLPNLCGFIEWQIKSQWLGGRECCVW